MNSARKIVPASTSASNLAGVFPSANPPNLRSDRYPLLGFRHPDTTTIGSEPQAPVVLAPKTVGAPLSVSQEVVDVDVNLRGGANEERRQVKNAEEESATGWAGMSESVPALTRGIDLWHRVLDRLVSQSDEYPNDHNLLAAIICGLELLTQLQGVQAKGILASQVSHSTLLSAEKLTTNQAWVLTNIDFEINRLRKILRSPDRLTTEEKYIAESQLAHYEEEAAR